jgi:hypothetical protein
MQDQFFFTHLFFDYFCPVKTSVGFRRLVAPKLAEQIRIKTGVDVSRSKKVVLTIDEGCFKYSQFRFSGSFLCCNLSIADCYPSRIDWTFLSKSNQEVTPEKEDLDPDDIEISIDFIETKTFLSSYYDSKPFKLPFKTSQFPFEVQTRSLTNDPLKMRVYFREKDLGAMIEELISVNVYHRNEKIEQGKLAGNVIHNMRPVVHHLYHIDFDFDFGMADTKPLKGFLDVLSKIEGVTRVIFYTYEEDI